MQICVESRALGIVEAVVVLDIQKHSWSTYTSHSTLLTALSAARAEIIWTPPVLRGDDLPRSEHDLVTHTPSSLNMHGEAASAARSKVKQALQQLHLSSQALGGRLHYTDDRKGQQSEPCLSRMRGHVAHPR